MAKSTVARIAPNAYAQRPQEVARAAAKIIMGELAKTGSNPLTDRQYECLIDLRVLARRYFGGRIPTYDAFRHLNRRVIGNLFRAGLIRHEVYKGQVYVVQKEPGEK